MSPLQAYAHGMKENENDNAINKMKDDGSPNGDRHFENELHASPHTISSYILIM